MVAMARAPRALLLLTLLVQGAVTLAKTRKSQQPEPTGDESIKAAARFLYQKTYHSGYPTAVEDPQPPPDKSTKKKKGMLDTLFGTKEAKAPKQTAEMSEAEVEMEAAVLEKTHAAIKKWLTLKAELAPPDLSWFVRYSDAADPDNQMLKEEQCTARAGCVTPDKMKVFLFHKYIPGFASEYPAETYIAPDWLPVAGHMFDPDCSLDTLLTDMRSYILTRPLHAVTKEVAELLFFDDMVRWPGGHGSNRARLFPQGMGISSYYEMDVDPVDVQATLAPSRMRAGLHDGSVVAAITSRAVEAEGMQAEMDEYKKANVKTLHQGGFQAGGIEEELNVVKEQLASLKPHTYTGVEGATSAEGEQLLHPRQIKPVILPQGALLDGWTAGATGGVNFLGTDRQETFQQEMVGNTAVETAGAMLELVDDPVPSPPPPRGTLPDGKVLVSPRCFLCKRKRVRKAASPPKEVQPAAAATAKEGEDKAMGMWTPLTTRRLLRTG